MAVFRVEKTKGYTVMSNHHLKNRALSLKAKGLLSLMLSLPDDWDYTMKGLSVISTEGIDAIRQAIAELEKQRYVVRARFRDEKGCLRGSEYVIYEQPPSKTAGEKPELDNPTSENPALDNPTLGNPTLGSPTLENPTQLNTKVRSTYPIRTAAANSNQSNPYPSYQSTEGARRRRQTRWDEKGCAAAAFHRESVHKRIEYDLLLQDTAIDKSRLDEIVGIMVETLCATNGTMLVAGNEYPTAFVQDRLRQINFQHIQYVFHGLSSNTRKVRNIKKYLLAVLYNAPSTMGGYYAAQVNHNFGGLAPDDF